MHAPTSYRARRLPSISLRATTAVMLATTLAVIPGPAVGSARESAAAIGGAPIARDVGELLGLPREVASWSVDGRDLSGDGRPDLVISHHGRIVAYRNLDGMSFDPIFQPGDIRDPHGCVIGDVDLDGLGDVYCTAGSGSGAGRNSNGLWMQVSPGTFSENVASDFGVDDPLGRGRRPTFVDIDGDGYPDLFVGNEGSRRDGKPSPNRTFLNEAGTGFREVRIGVTREIGAHCAQAVDFIGNGWQDLLLCGSKRLFLFRNVAGPDGTRRFKDVADARGIRIRNVRSAWMADFDSDGRLDIVVVQRDRVRVILRAGARFRTVVLDRKLRQGRWVAVGDVDGRRGPDVYVVQGCRDGINLRNRLFLNRGRGLRFDRTRNAHTTQGCGDVATTLDIDGDRADEIVVLNGRPAGQRGPVQVLTIGTGLLPGSDIG